MLAGSKAIWIDWRLKARWGFHPLSFPQVRPELHSNEAHHACYNHGRIGPANSTKICSNENHPPGLLKIIDHQQKHLHNSTSWWFQPLWKILVTKLLSFFQWNSYFYMHKVSVSELPKTSRFTRRTFQDFPRDFLHGARWSPRPFLRETHALSFLPHGIHVWYIYLNLVDFYGKRRWIYHTWMLRDMLLNKYSNAHV